MEAKDVLSGLKRLDRATWNEVYYRHRENFINWACHEFSLPREDARDIYQDVMVELFLQLQADSITGVNCSMQTFLFGFGKRILIDDKRRRKTHTVICRDISYTGNKYVGSQAEVLFTEAHLKAKVDRYLSILSDKEYGVIIDIFYHNLTAKEIVAKRNLPSVDTVWQIKCRAIQKIRQCFGIRPKVIN